MQFLKTLFWVLIAVAGVIFSYNNWLPVSVSLWGGLVLDTKLPVLLIAAFLIGLVPTLLLHRATRWNLRRKLDNAERSLTEIRNAANPPAPAAPPVLEHKTMPPAAAPIAVPPGVS
jgi:lipopolysaccharide assembly protein A